jgi:hypothetical protein
MTYKEMFEDFAKRKAKPYEVLITESKGYLEIEINGHKTIEKQIHGTFDNEVLWKKAVEKILLSGLFYFVEKREGLTK